MKKSKGFTFIEILVVVTLIAILVMVGVISYSSINKRTRDARRKSDIEQVRSALEMYRADYGYYPDGGSTVAFTSLSDVSLAGFRTALTSYISTFPSDPKDNVEYPYKIMMTNPRGTPSHNYGYCLAAFMEGAGSGFNSCGIALPNSTTTAEAYTHGMINP